MGGTFGEAGRARKWAQQEAPPLGWHLEQVTLFNIRCHEKYPTQPHAGSGGIRRQSMRARLVWSHCCVCVLSVEWHLEAAFIVVEDVDAGLAGHGHQTRVAFAYVHARQGLAVGRDPPLLLDVVPLGLQLPSPGRTRREHHQVPILRKAREASQHPQLAATPLPLSSAAFLALYAAKVRDTLSCREAASLLSPSSLPRASMQRQRAGRQLAIAMCACAMCACSMCACAMCACAMCACAMCACAKPD